VKPIINRRASKRVTSYYRDNRGMNRALKSGRESEQKQEIQKKEKGAKSA
jgi:hypothetical protein